VEERPFRAAYWSNIRRALAPVVASPLVAQRTSADIHSDDIALALISECGTDKTFFSAL
jgi:hypothetical protein